MSKRKHHVTVRSRVKTTKMLALKAVADSRGMPVARLLEQLIDECLASAKQLPPAEATAAC